jgi:hypothetical protein
MRAFWKPLPACLRPGATGMIVFAVLIALQACLGTSSGTGTVGPEGVYETASSRSMGWPPSVVITSKTTADGATRSGVDVHWAPLLFTCALTYCLAMAAGHMAMRKRRRRHPAMILITVIGGTLLLAFLASIVVSKSLWGYYLYRPSLDRRIVSAQKILSVTTVNTALANDERTLVSDTSFSIAKQIEYGQTDDYYSLGERVLIALKHENRLPTSPPPMSPDRLSRLYGVLARTARLEAGETGYDHARDLRGVVIEAEGSDGSPLVFAGVQGGEVSNDHHPYYEFLFSGPDPAGALKLLSVQQFYFDVAGIEGMEWYVFFVGFSALGIVLSVPVTLLVLAVWPSRFERVTRTELPGVRDL